MSFDLFNTSVTEFIFQVIWKKLRVNIKRHSRKHISWFNLCYKINPKKRFKKKDDSSHPDFDVGKEIWSCFERKLQMSKVIALQPSWRRI